MIPKIKIGKYKITYPQLLIDVNESLQDAGIMEDKITAKEAEEITKKLFLTLDDKYSK